MENQLSSCENRKISLSSKPVVKCKARTGIIQHKIGLETRPDLEKTRPTIPLALHFATITLVLLFFPITFQNIFVTRETGLPPGSP
jgi:hypothetical protein